MSVARLSSIGIYMGLCIGLCTWLGLWADGRYGTGTLYTLIGFGVGTAAAFFGLFRELARLSRKDE
ncbi:MAG TPA: AtpZ/AtpI family protein [Armatimonadota bacterium]|jgi:hypothetical protein